MLNIKFEKFRELEPYETLQKRTKSYLTKEIIKEILSGICAVMPKIHKIALSSNYLYLDVDSKFGSLKFDAAYLSQQIKNYGTRAFRKVKETNFIFYFDAIGGFRPNCFVDVVYKGHQPLCELNEAMPDFKVSSIEYAIDFFVEGNDRADTARRIFLLFYHYIYLPGKRRTMFFNNRDNWTFYIGSENGLKVYERGADECKIRIKSHGNSGWLKKDIDRVRVELTLSRDLKDFHVDSFNGFLNDCRFKDVIEYEIEFRHFVEKNRFPMQWEEYATGCANGEFNGFQREYLEQKRIDTVTKQRDTTIEPLITEYMEMVVSRVESYAKNWRTKTALHKNRKDRC